jgi:hypothetical protein
MNAAETPLDSPGGASLETLKRLDSELATALGGLPYLFARSVYANELTLHFGSERAYISPKLPGKVRGTHVLSVRGSAWLLQSGVRPVMVGCGVVPIASPGSVKPFNVTALESGALIGQGAVVARATSFVVEALNAIGLSIQLDDGSRFTVLPTPPANDGDDLPEPADWEALTPTRILRVGPGPEYSVEILAPQDLVQS